LPDDYPRLTFGHMVDRNQLVWIQCRSCWREVEILAGAMPQRIPHETPFPKIVKFLKCRCGSREISVMPEVYPGGFMGAWSCQWEQSSREIVVAFRWQNVLMKTLSD